MSVASEPIALAPGWLRNPTFDLTFIGGIALLALAAGGAVTLMPALFAVLLVLDLWLLGYHHVIATYTRIAFDSESFRTYRFLVLWLPLIVLGMTVALILLFGSWVLPTVYFYWQWFHYTRQSYGVAQIYRRKADGMADEPRVALGVIYLLPLWGVLYRSWQEPATFLGMEIRMLPVPREVVDLAGAIACAAVLIWVVRQLVAWRNGRLPLAYTFYMLSHIAIFGVAYILIDDINHGWLTVNIWHNAQYVLIVWMFNTNRFKQGVDPKHRFLSSISQPDRIVTYFVVCIGISTAVYLALQQALSLAGLSVVAFALVIYQTINFHHYVVDAIIWKVRKPAVRAHLNLAS